MAALSRSASDSIVLRLEADETEVLRDLAMQVAVDPYQDFESFLTAARLVAEALPTRIQEPLSLFAEHGSVDGALMLCNLPQDTNLPSTPSKPGERATVATHASELWMCAVASILGEPIAYRQERAASIVQEVFPTEEHADKMSSQSSSAPLAFHTEMVFHPYSPDFLLIYGMRQDKEKQARTLFSSARKFLPLLSDEVRETLFSTAFALAYSHIHSPYLSMGKPVSVCEGLGPDVAVLYGERSDPYLRYEPELMVAQTPEAKTALGSLQTLVNQCSREVVVEAGSLLIFDNRRCAHARTPFTARFDGQDRWLRRMHVARSLEPSARDRLPGSRTIDTDLGAGWARIT